RQNEDGEELGGAELEGLQREREREEGEEDRRDEGAEERRDERARESEAGLAEALREGETVEKEHDRPRLAGDVEKDRGDDTAEERAPVDPGQENDRRGRIGSRQRTVRDEDRDRQEDRHTARPAEPRKHPDDQTEHDRDEQHGHV